MKRVAIVAVALLVASNAHAQRKPKKKPTVVEPAPAPAPPPPPANPSLGETLTGDAKVDYESGKVLFSDGDFAGALVKFEGAFGKSKDPRLLWNMAACEKNLRHYARVLDLVRRYVAEGGSKLDDKDRAEAAELLKTVEPLTSSLKINVNVEGAEVLVDDAVVGTTPLAKPVVVDIGMRRIRVRKDDHKEYVAQVPVGGTPEVMIEAKLDRIVHEGKLSVNAREGEAIYVDGRLVGSGRWEGVVKSGGHQVRVVAPKMRPFQSEVIVQDQDTRLVQVTLEAEPETRAPVPAWVWVAGGAVVLAGAGVGGYFLFKPEDKPADIPSGNLAPGSVQASFRLR